MRRGLRFLRERRPRRERERERDLLRLLRFFFSLG